MTHRFRRAFCAGTLRERLPELLCTYTHLLSAPVLLEGSESAILKPHRLGAEPDVGALALLMIM
jgi:hypothetical protein